MTLFDCLQIAGDTPEKDNNMDVLETLQSNVNQWADAIDERKARADFLRGECDRLVGETIDLSEAKAKQARKDRAECLTELELLAAQLSELHRRHEIAEQAVKEYQVNQAREAYERADAEARAKRLELDAALNERLRFNNRHGRETEADINGRKDIEVRIATLTAAARIAGRNQAEAGAALKALQIQGITG
jgi:hypothetical protein